MADTAVASSARGGVIRQNRFGIQYRDPFTPNRRLNRGGGRGGGSSGGYQSGISDEEAARLDAEERARQAAEEAARLAAEKAQQEANKKRTLGGQLDNQKSIGLAGTGGTVNTVKTPVGVATRQSFKNLLGFQTIGSKGFGAYYDSIFDPFRSVAIRGNPNQVFPRKGTEERGTITTPYSSDIAINTYKSPAQLQIQQDVLTGVPFDLVGTPTQFIQPALNERAYKIGKKAQGVLDTDIAIEADRLQSNINLGKQSYESAVGELNTFADIRSQQINKQYETELTGEYNTFINRRRNIQDVLPSGAYGAKTTTGDLLKGGVTFGAYLTPGLGETLLVTEGYKRYTGTLLSDKSIFQKGKDIGIASVEFGLAATTFGRRYGPRGTLAREIAAERVATVNYRASIPRGLGPRSLINQEILYDPKLGVGFGKGTLPGNEEIVLTQFVKTTGKNSARFGVAINRPSVRVIDDPLDGIFAQEGRETIFLTGSGKVRAQGPLNDQILQRLTDVKIRPTASLSRFGTETIGKSFPLTTSPFKSLPIGSIFKTSASGKLSFEAGSTLRKGRTSTTIREDSFGSFIKPNIKSGSYLDKNLVEVRTLRDEGYITQVRTLTRVAPEEIGGRVGTKIGKSGRRSSKQYLDQLYAQQVGQIGTASTSAAIKQLKGIGIVNAKSLVSNRGADSVLKSFSPSLIGGTSKQEQTLFSGIRGKALRGSGGILVPPRERERTKGDINYIKLSATTPLILTKPRSRGAEATSLGIGQIVGSAQAQPLKQESRLVTPPPIFNTPPTRITPPSRTNITPRGSDFFIPPFTLPNFSEGQRRRRGSFALESPFEYSPSFTALTFGLRGGRQPKRFKTGFDPTVLRRIGATPFMAKASKKKKRKRSKK